MYIYKEKQVLHTMLSVVGTIILAKNVKRYKIKKIERDKVNPRPGPART